MAGHYTEPSRFTPTHVGTMITSISEARDYAGSPPRTWGRWGIPVVRAAPSRFTPTHVGTMDTPTGNVHRGALRFTPTHVGTIRSSCTSCHAARGSPPRTWGRWEVTSFSRCSSRFTPTHVGTMPPFAARHLRIAVHPHARGDDTER